MMSRSLSQTGEAKRRFTWPTGTPQIVALLLVLLVDSLVAPHFFQIVVQDGRLFGSPIDILNRAAPVALLAIGMTLVIATGGIDLSVGAVMAIAGATAASMTVAGHSLPVVLLAALGSGVLAGLWNGILVAVLKIQPFVATLILMVAGRGVAQLITSGQIVTFNSPSLAWIGSGNFLFFPTPVIVALITGLVIGLAIGYVIILARKFTINQSNSTYGADVMMGAGNASGRFLGPLIILSAMTASIPIGVGSLVGALLFYIWQKPITGGAILGAMILGWLFPVAL
ncbi:TPA: DUF4310 family protein [Enterobacter hormaechei subsp. steigerwaltii]|nr:DUF4310 family protein [Enterobacter hormaechei subsp. steigerwaltii]